MPLFEFVCKDCNEKFEKIVFSINNETIECPKCKSKNVQKQFSLFASGNSASSNGCSDKGSADCASKQHHHCCNGCCHH